MSELVVHVFRLNGLLIARGDAMAEPSGQTSARWRVLAAIDEQPLSVAQIARAWCLTRQSVQRIAEALGIERKTVENHISNVYRKLGLDGVDQSATGLRKATLLAKAFMIYDLMSDREDA